MLPQIKNTKTNNIGNTVLTRKTTACVCAPEVFVKGNADATAVIHICSMKRYGMFRDTFVVRGRSAPRQSPHRPNVVNRGASSSLYASEIESSIMARRSPSRTLVRTPSRITSNAVPMTTGRWMLRRKIDSCPRLGQIKWPQVRSREGKLDLGYEGEQTTKKVELPYFQLPGMSTHCCWLGQIARSRAHSRRCHRISTRHLLAKMFRIFCKPAASHEFQSINHL